MGTHNLQWFIDRIGKRIYRDANGCPCNRCDRVFKEGIVIHDMMHADYMYEMQGGEGLENCLNYRDEK